MRVIVSGKRRLLRIPAAIGAVALVVIVATVFLLRGGDTPEDGDTMTGGTPDIAVNTAVDDTAFAAVLNTLEHYGAVDSEQAVAIWAEGVAARNGVTQYSVMSTELKEKYIGVVGETNDGAMLFPTSNSTVDSWFVSDVTDNDDGTVTAKLRFTMGETVANAELTLTDEGEYTVVSAVAVEAPLYEFTGIG